MRRAAAALIGIACVVGVTACSDDGGDPPSTTGPTTEPTEATPDPSRTEPEPTEPDASHPEQVPFDPRDVDLGSAEWTFSVAGWEDEPVDVTLTDGSADITVHDWDGEVVLSRDPLYVDMDGDGDEDAVAALDFSAGVSSDSLEWVATSWFVWINDGSDLIQMLLPLEGSGECADADPQITPADDVGIVIEQNLFPIEGGTCAEGATIPTERTVVLQEASDGVNWLVQTAPVAAWGGDCPFVSELGYNPIDALVAPGIDEPAPDEGTAALAETPPSWLDDYVPGWYPVAFTVDERPDLTWYCGWRQS